MAREVLNIYNLDLYGGSLLTTWGWFMNKNISVVEVEDVDIYTVEISKWQIISNLELELWIWSSVSH